MSFRFLHLSDLHMRADTIMRGIATRRPSVAGIVNEALYLQGLKEFIGLTAHSPSLASHLADFVREHVERHDLVIISGDLAATGTPNDIDLAQAYVHGGPVRRIVVPGHGTSPSLNLKAEDVLVLPGNHDRFRDDWGEPGGTRFDEVFWPSNGTSRNGVGTKRLTSIDGASEIAVVTGDFCLRSESDASFPAVLCRAGQGRAYADVLDEMRVQTDSLRADNHQIGIVWASHFPPKTSDPLLKLIDGEDLVIAARNSNVRYILAGHIHRNDSIDLHGVNIVCAGSGCADKQKYGNWAHSLTFEVNRGRVTLVQRENYRFGAVEQDFVIV